MSFSFGAATSGSAPTPTFGAFGAAPAASSAAPAFGAPSTGSFFNIGTSPSFPVSAAPASTSGFSFAPAAASVAFPAASSSFSFSTPASGALVPSSQPLGFGAQPQQQQQQQQQQGSQITPSTKFEELPPQYQQALTQIQDLISNADANMRSVLNMKHLTQGYDQQQLLEDARELRSALASLQNTVAADADALADFRSQSVRLLQACEQVVRTFTRTWAARHGNKAPGSQVPLPSEALNAPVLLPNPFLEEAILGFRDNVGQYRKLVGDLEQALALRAGGGPAPGGLDVVTALPTIISNMHDYFVHVAAKLDKVHTEVEKLKQGYLARRGGMDNPFNRLRRQRAALMDGNSSFGSSSGGWGGQGLLMGPGGGAGSGGGVMGGGVMGAAAGGVAGALPAPGNPGSAMGFAPSMSPAPSLPGSFQGAASFGSPFPGTPAAGSSALVRTASKTGRSGKKAR